MLHHFEDLFLQWSPLSLRSTNLPLYRHELERLPLFNDSSFTLRD